MSIPRGTIEKIQEAADIVEVVSGYVPLKKAGKDFKALCPFHPEKTPSFFVVPSKQIFHCFGCGAGGDVFRFLMEMEKLPFVEAVETLGRQLGIPVPRRVGGEDERKEELYRANVFASGWFAEQLKKSPPARDYLRRRGIRAESVERFAVGYAPAQGWALQGASRKRGIPDAILKRVGLIVESGRDRFRNRLIFPICDSQGRPVGFSGRALGDAGPKYLNTPQTPLFDKSRCLFGIHLAKEAMVRRKKAIVCEGQIDCVLLQQEGVRHAVASQGTAFTDWHARTLKRYVQEVVLAFDADRAGEEAAIRGVESFLSQALTVRVAILPAGHDPDSFIRERGRESFERLVEAAPHVLDFLVNRMLQKYNMATPEGQASGTRELLAVLARIRDDIVRDLYLNRISENLKISKNVLLTELKKRDKIKIMMSDGGKGPPEGPPSSLKAGDRELILVMLHNPEMASDVWRSLTPADFEEGPGRSLAEEIFGLWERGLWKGHAALIGEGSSREAGSLVSRLLTESAGVSDWRKTLDDSVRLLKRRGLEKRIKDAEDLLKSEKEGIRILELQREYNKLSSELRAWAEKPK